MTSSSNKTELLPLKYPNLSGWFSRMSFSLIPIINTFLASSTCKVVPVSIPGSLSDMDTLQKPGHPGSFFLPICRPIFITGPAEAKPTENKAKIKNNVIFFICLTFCVVDQSFDISDPRCFSTLAVNEVWISAIITSAGIVNYTSNAWTPEEQCIAYPKLPSGS